jgi:hypothetical protein
MTVSSVQCEIFNSFKTFNSFVSEKRIFSREMCERSVRSFCSHSDIQNGSKFNETTFTTIVFSEIFAAKFKGDFQMKIRLRNESSSTVNKV